MSTVLANSLETPDNQRIPAPATDIFTPFSKTDGVQTTNGHTRQMTRVVHTYIMRLKTLVIIFISPTLQTWPRKSNENVREYTHFNVENLFFLTKYSVRFSDLGENTTLIASVTTTTYSQERDRPGTLSIAHTISHSEYKLTCVPLSNIKHLRSQTWKGIGYHMYVLHGSTRPLLSRHLTSSVQQNQLWICPGPVVAHFTG